MKLKLLLRITVFSIAAVVIVITLNMNFNANSDLSDVALANIEALARSEDDNCDNCHGPKVENQNGTHVYCTCQNQNCCKDATGCGCD